MQHLAIGNRADPGAHRRAVGPGRLDALLAPLDLVLAGGGDTRLAVDPREKLNAYGCRPYPRPEAFTFASSTATSISERGYARAGEARHTLLAAGLGEADAIEARLAAMRTELLSLLGLAGSGTEIVFSPSGTDAQLQALFATRALLPGPLTSIVVAADETGSGTGLAVTGHHFNTVTALGRKVGKGVGLAGLAEDVARIDIAANDAAGRPRRLEAIDAETFAAAEAAIAAGRRVLLQTMDRSKLWRRAPSRGCIAAIRARWPEHVQLVVDACQMRLSPARIGAYLALEAMVLVTGSKFFTGPPFSGALLVPAARAAGLEGFLRVPQGLRAYSNRADWPARWRALRRQLPDGFNPGQWLRWEAALAEMQAYASVPQGFRHAAIAGFAAAAARRIEAAGFELLEAEPRDASDGLDDGEFEPRTILPFLLHRDGAALAPQAVAGLYRALNCDVADQLPPGARAEDRRLAARLCHIGQPVAVRDRTGTRTAALRISAGARIVSDNWDGEAARAHARLAFEREQVDIILRKLALLLRHRIGA